MNSSCWRRELAASVLSENSTRQRVVDRNTERGPIADGVSPNAPCASTAVVFGDAGRHFLEFNAQVDDGACMRFSTLLLATPPCIVGSKHSVTCRNELKLICISAVVSSLASDRSRVKSA
jgi:hypothetical protein